MFEDVYEVKYRTYNQWFWRTIKDVVEDGISGVDVSTIPFRFFMTKNLTRIEIPINGTLFKFAPERAEIARRLEIEKKKLEVSEEQKDS